MKLKKCCLMFGIVCLMVTFLPLSGASAAADVIKLKFANYFPPQSSQSKLSEDFIADFEERTNGRVKFQYFPGGSLLKAPAMIKGIEMGITDIGLSHVSYTAGRFPVTEVCELPHGYPTAWVACIIMNDFYEKFKPKEWDSVVPLWFHANGPSTLAMKNPIRKMEDFKGQTIRAPGRMAAVISALGGTPAPTPIMESYDAVAKGVIQGVFVAAEGVRTFRFGEVVSAVTVSWNIGPSYPMYVAMNKRSYEKLPPDIRSILDKLAGEYREKFALMWNYNDFPGIEFGRSQGAEIIELSQEEFDRWVEAVQPVFEEYVKEMVGKGFAESEVRGWIKFLNERKNVLLERQKQWHIKSITGPAEVR